MPPDATVPAAGPPSRSARGLRIDDFDAVATLGGVCDRLGIDVILRRQHGRVGGPRERRGLIDPADHGVDRGLSFGDEAAARALIEEIAARSTPLGDALADGVAAAAERFGGTDLVPTVKGMELASYDPRGGDDGAGVRDGRPRRLPPARPAGRDRSGGRSGMDA